MTSIPGTVIGAQVVPSDSTDTYSTHEDIYGKGGFRSVTDLTERNSISTQRRKEGMLVFVASEQKTYQLKGGIDNTDWIEFETGSGTVSGETYQVPFFVGTDSLSGSNDFIYDFDTGTLSISGAFEVNGTVITDILDEDDMVSNSSTALATQQSIKAYVDNNISTDPIYDAMISPNVTGDVIDTVDISGGMVEWSIVITDSTNYRSEKIITVSDGITVEYAGHMTQDIGNTSDVVFDVDITGTQTVLKANNSGSSSWMVRLIRKSISI